MPKSIRLPKAEHRKFNILLVDDDPDMLEMNHEILRNENYQLTTAISGEAATEILRTKNFDLVITDLNMGQVNGISVLKNAKGLHPETMVIITTGNIDVHYAIEAMQFNVDDYILKPFKIEALLNRVLHCFEKQQIKRGNRKSAA